MNKKIGIFVIFEFLFVAAMLISGEDALGERLESVFGKVGSIDGVLNEQIWEQANTFRVPLKIASGEQSTASFLVVNDEKNVYLGFQFSLPAGVTIQSFSVRFDDENKGHFYEGQDVIALNAGRKKSGTFRDHVRTNRPPCKVPKNSTSTGHCGLHDYAVGGTTDGAGSYRLTGTEAVYEFSHPLKSEDKENDIQVEPGALFRLQVWLRLIEDEGTYSKGSIIDTYYPKNGYIEILLAN